MSAGRVGVPADASPVRGCVAGATGESDGVGEGVGVVTGTVALADAVTEGVETDGVDEHPASNVAARTSAGNTTTVTEEDRRCITSRGYPDSHVADARTHRVTRLAA